MDVGEALALLAQQPGFVPDHESARIKGVRRLLVGHIRYFIHYRVTAEVVEVMIVWQKSGNTPPAL